MDIESINTAIDAAFAAALADPAAVPPTEIAAGVTLQTNTYEHPDGSGFQVMCVLRIPDKNFMVVRIRNHGPDTAAEKPWPVGGIEAALKQHMQRHLLAVERHVLSYFSALALLEASKKIISHTLNNTLTEIPKTLAVQAWIEQLKSSMHLNETAFPGPPHTFEEIVLE